MPDETTQPATADAESSGVSKLDATAIRYLEILEKEGKIKQVGKTGKEVMYEKI